jgi:sulfonate transport system substrate-binding protein
VNIKRYLAKYGPEGGTTLKHGLRDDPGHLYAPVKVLQDPAKAAALREYVQHWGVAQRWIEDHPKEWRDGYYVRNQNLSPDDGEYLIKAAGRGHPHVLDRCHRPPPEDRRPVVARTRQTQARCPQAV